ncbi:hypothetical protein ABEX44_21205 [Priestia megaterium]
MRNQIRNYFILNKNARREGGKILKIFIVDYADCPEDKNEFINRVNTAFSMTSRRGSKEGDELIFFGGANSVKEITLDF